MIGIFSFVQLLANLISPFLGSFITKQLGWHWIFFGTFGILLVALIFVILGKQASQVSQRVRWTEIDILGGLSFGIFCVLAVRFSDVISNQGRVDLSGFLFFIDVVIAGIFLVWNESRHKDPVIKVAFFRSKVLRRSIVSSLIAGSIMYGLVTILPLCSVILNQQGFQINDSQVLMVFMLATTIGVLVASRLITKLSTNFPKILWGLSVVGAILLYYAISISNIVLYNVATGILGLLLGGITATLLINSQNAVNNEDRTVLSGIVQLGRYLGGAIGVTILTGILPEVSQMIGAAQFLGAFGLLVVMYIVGVVNELI